MSIPIINEKISVQREEAGEDGRVVQAERREELGGAEQLDPSGAEGALEGRHPQGRPDGHRPGPHEVPQTHLPVSEYSKKEQC